MPPKHLSKESEQNAKRFAVIGDPARMQILESLSKGNPKNVSELAEEIGMAVACTSYHLQLLKEHELIESVRSGNSIFYSLKETSFTKHLKLFLP